MFASFDDAVFGILTAGMEGWIGVVRRGESSGTGLAMDAAAVLVVGDIDMGSSCVVGAGFDMVGEVEDAAAVTTVCPVLSNTGGAAVCVRGNASPVDISSAISYPGFPM